jgi:hypothetical protein
MIVASVALLSITLAKQPQRAPSTFVQGDLFPSFPGVHFADSRMTLVMWLSTNCVFCDRSMDFYRRLSALPNRARIVVAGRESEPILAAYLARHGVVADKIVSMPSLRETKLGATPMLVLVERNSRVRSAWRGLLVNQTDQDAVVKAVGM